MYIEFLVEYGPSKRGHMNSVNNPLTFPSHIRKWVHPLEEGLNTSTAQEKACYESALNIAEKLFMKIPIKSLAEWQFHTMLSLVHLQLVTDSEDNPGHYRSKEDEGVAIGKVAIDGDLVEHLVKNDQQSLPSFQEVQMQLQRGKGLDEMVNDRLVSAAAIDFIHRYFHICPSPKHVYSLMETMRQEVQKKLESKEDPIDIASFAHMEIGRIHPFRNANGRIARIFMNVILMQGGHQPIAFCSEETYTNAVKDPQEFNKLVRNLSRMFDYEAEVDKQLKKC